MNVMTFKAVVLSISWTD